MELPFIFEIVVLGVPFLAGLVYLIEEARLHQKPLRRLASPKLIGLGILVASLWFLFQTTAQVFSNPTSETVLGSLPSLILSQAGWLLGTEILFPTTQQGL